MTVTVILSVTIINTALESERYSSLLGALKALIVCENTVMPVVMEHSMSVIERSLQII